ncbi:hypothetical protein AGMMS50218_11440 [Actinomycetota bacterium]|nr:hypothetical protein AGMMS50218_11440 [Actinomycetota bacterium]
MAAEVTLTRPGPERDARPAQRPGSWPAELLLSLPDRLPVVVLCLGITGLLAILAGVFHPWVVLPVGAAVVAATWRLVPAPAGRGRADLVATGGVLLFSVGWVLANLRYAAQYVVVNRDPGFLTLEALWLRQHGTGPISVGSAAAVDAAVENAHAGTEAFLLQSGGLYAQGNKMLPGLLAMLGWAGGPSAVLTGNLVIGALALLAVFAAGRRFMSPLWSLVPVVALALSFPFLVFTRAAYTEPLTVVLAFAGLAVAVAAFRGGATGHFALSGALLGGVAVARIDGAVVLVGMALGFGIAAALTLAGPLRRRRTRQVQLALAVGGSMLVLGFVDVALLSPDYVREHTAQISLLLAATAITFAVVLTALARPHLTARMRVAAYRHRDRGAKIAVWLVLGTGVLLASRPLWWEDHNISARSGAAVAVRGMQLAEGMAVSPTRSYDEQTITWLSWYLGWPAVVLGFVGLALLARRAVRGRDASAVVLVCVIGVSSLFYLVRISITPDQMWAVRRLLPVAIPGLLLAAAWALHEIADTAVRWRRAAAVGLAVVVAGFPLTTWGSVTGEIELAGRYDQAKAVCRALDERGIDHVVWVHSSPFRYLATLRVVCGVEVVEFVDPPKTWELAQVAQAWGDERVGVLSFDPDDLPWWGDQSQPVGTTVSTELHRTLSAPPTTLDVSVSSVWIGLLREDGFVDATG